MILILAIFIFSNCESISAFKTWTTAANSGEDHGKTSRDPLNNINKGSYGAYDELNDYWNKNKHYYTNIFLEPLGIRFIKRVIMSIVL